MDRKEELLRAEDERWREFSGLVNRLTPKQMELPELNEDGWSVKDLLCHMGAWNAESARELERIRLGTYTERDYNTDEENARFLEEGRRQELATVRTEWIASRNRALKEWSELPEITPEAEEWFYESGAEHMDDHLPELRAFVEKVT